MRPSTTSALTWIAAAGGTAMLVYLFAIRPWQLGWGATEDEMRAAMPGDELVAAPTFVSTRAVTIAAPPALVWPWIAQLGQGRGGFYSYDWIENLIGLDIHSADRVLEQYQQPMPGETIALAPDGSGLEVERVEPDEALVLREPGGGWTWSFQLRPQGAQTRLLARNRWTTAGAPLSFRLYMLLMDPASFVMERKMLLGIKDRTES
jgi:hypothetical protein